MLSLLRELHHDVKAANQERMTAAQDRGNTYESQLNGVYFKTRTAQVLRAGALGEIGIGAYSALEGKPASALFAVAVGSLCLRLASRSSRSAELQQEQADLLEETRIATEPAPIPV